MHIHQKHLHPLISVETRRPSGSYLSRCAAVLFPSVTMCQPHRTAVILFFSVTSVCVEFEVFFFVRVAEAQELRSSCT